MFKLKQCEPVYPYEYDDCVRIQKAYLQRGIECSISQAKELWSNRSNKWDACWLGLPDDDQELINQIEEYNNIGYIPENP